jgi:hypothetical protein
MALPDNRPLLNGYLQAESLMEPFVLGKWPRTGYPGEPCDFFDLLCLLLTNQLY